MSGIYYAYDCVILASSTIVCVCVCVCVWYGRERRVGGDCVICHNVCDRPEVIVLSLCNPTHMYLLGEREREREVRSSHGHCVSHTHTQVPLNFDDDNLPSPSGSVPSTPIHASSIHLPTRLHLYNSLEVAQELSILDGELLRKIDPEELKNGAWMKKNKVGHLLTHITFLIWYWWHIQVSLVNGM